MIFRGVLRAILIALPFAVEAAQPSAPSPIAAPLRDLPWGQLNFLHTTDTHGWHAGHLQEYDSPFSIFRSADHRCRPSYSADWGDYISFSERLHEKADREKVDILLIDTGDRVEGNGLYDASDPKGVFTSGIIKELDIDIICSGNHELYKKKTSQREYSVTAPNFHGNYLASNIDIFDAGTGKRVPLAQRYKKFTTKNQGIRVLAFGFLFDFTGNANNTIVQPVAQTIQEKWFQEAIRDRKVDLFLVTGHVPLRSPEFDLIFKAIRSQQWDVPIQFFGGHTHIRDYAKYDAKAYALESGRYMETIGFMSISGLRSGGKPASEALEGEGEVSAKRASPTFSRRYIDNNVFSFHHHTSLNATTFPTEHGRNVSAVISAARKMLKLDEQFGCAPTDLWTNRAPYPNENSIFSWIQDTVLPDMLKGTNCSDSPKLALLNTGSLRFDIFKGPFTVDTTYSVSPFTSGFRQIRNVPFGVAKQLLRILNQEVPQLERTPRTLRAKEPVALEQIEIESRYLEDAVNGRYRDSHQSPLALGNPESSPLTPGYTTSDDAGNDGDDTLHSKIQFYRVPNCIETRVGFPESSSSSDPETVDLVYGSFIENYILLALRFLGTDYALGDTESFADGQSFTALLAKWVQENWAGEC